jgi:hypothetical protein
MMKSVSALKQEALGKTIWQKEEPARLLLKL